MEIEKVEVGFLACINVQVVKLDFAFFLKDERKDLAVRVPCQQRERSVDVLVGAVTCLEKLLPFAALHIFEPKTDLSLVVADVCDISTVRTDARLSEGAVFFVFQLHWVGGLVGEQGSVTCLVKLKPFLNQNLVFLAGNIEQRLFHVLRAFGQG